MQFKEELQSMKYTVTDQRCTSFINDGIMGIASSSSGVSGVGGLGGLGSGHLSPV